MENESINYEMIKKANKEIKSMEIKRVNKNTGEVTIKKYAPVNERVIAFRKVYPKGKIITELLNCDEKGCTFKCTITDSLDNFISNAYANEKKAGPINLTSMIENCETSAVGRALGFAGFGIDASISSADEINQTKEKEKEYEELPMSEEQIKIIANLDPQLKEQLRNFYGKDVMKLSFREAEVSINSMKKKRLIKTEQEEKYEEKESEEIF